VKIAMGIHAYLVVITALIDKYAEFAFSAIPNIIKVFPAGKSPRAHQGRREREPNRQTERFAGGQGSRCHGTITWGDTERCPQPIEGTSKNELGTSSLSPYTIIPDSNPGFLKAEGPVSRFDSTLS